MLSLDIHSETDIENAFLKVSQQLADEMDRGDKNLFYQKT